MFEAFETQHSVPSGWGLSTVSAVGVEVGVGVPGSAPDAPAADSVDGADGSHPIGATGSTIQKLNTIRCNIRDDPQGNSTNIGQSARYPRISKTLQVVLSMSLNSPFWQRSSCPWATLAAQDILNRVDAHDWELTVEIRLSSEVPIQLGPDGRPMGFFVRTSSGLFVPLD